MNSRPQLAQDIMVTRLFTLDPQTRVFDGISRLLKNRISGAPVVEERRKYVGVFSEKCCLRVLSTTAKLAKASTKKSLTANDVMNTNLVTLSPEMDVFEAIAQLLKHKISGAPVVDRQGKVVGSFSEKNSMSVLIESAYAQMPTSIVREFMHFDADRMIGAEMDLLEIVEMFLNTPYRRLQVVRDGKLIGQISRRDALGAAHRLVRKSGEKREALQRVQEADAEELKESSADQQQIAAFLDATARTISPETDLLEMAHIFSDSNYRRLPVIAGGELMGQVSRRDLLAATNKLIQISPKREKSLLYLSSLVDRQESPIE